MNTEGISECVHKTKQIPALFIKITVKGKLKSYWDVVDNNLVAVDGSVSTLLLVFTRSTGL